MGRTGPLFAFEDEGARPDILTLGKGLGGGLPISALLATEAAACFQDGDHGSTFGGNALCSAAALSVLSVLASPDGRAEREGSAQYLARALSRVAKSFGGSLRGRGHLLGIVLPSDSAVSIRNRAFELGLLINPARPNVLRLMPALNVTNDAIDEMAALLTRAGRDS
jgi:acetylornithine/N-succinyldiaminopimelate aminotransferase